MWQALNELHPTTRRLLAARAVRSIAQGALVVDLSLYMHALHWSGLEIGLTLTAGGLLAAAFSMLIGVVSDRFKRKPFLLANEGLTVLCGLAPLVSATPAALAAAVIVGGFGRGRAGSAGPFAPAEQAWLAENVPPAQRGWIYSLNSALGFFGMTLGALLAITPSFLLAGVGVHFAYSPIFVVVVLGGIVNLWLLGGAREQRSASQAVTSSKGGADRAQVRRFENRILWRLFQLNTLNGLSIGLTSTLIAYWFALRYHIGPGEIAPLMAVTFLVAGVSAILAGRVTLRHGLVSSVLWSRGIGAVLLAIFPLMPWFWLAALVYMLRLATSGASVGARQAQVMVLVRDERRGLAASVNAASFQVPQSVGPGIAGPMIAAGMFLLPFYVAAGLQVLYVVGYGRVFRRYAHAGSQGSDDSRPR
ncbi:MAG: MFS transporter [Gammaproteobacteria bacterium]|nr:MFS transporter [Gammaproteobacteria bacterium]MBU6509853.1 MFS transporter [Gammaproteobacteria bacterium]MDE1984000.1 MFS transporter [Gammaproteobacteria bacterium]MDE2108071.1 MFS transporter [Gammaproteobacteria bacterium]MDE2461388.1 MFS transporter [Gammaproteobacteria bacterium]